MQPWRALPNAKLSSSHPRLHAHSDPQSQYAHQFHQLGLTDFHQACDYVWQLVYGRNRDNHDWRAVLTEKRGTCSSKHRLLKALADELELNIELVIGIYPMKASNTPGVDDVLAQSQYDFIPEAHCYLRFEGQRIDLTRANLASAEPIDEFFVEIAVEANELAHFKQLFHYQYLVEHYGEAEASAMWQCREQCIAALSA